jgi:hypothetical protein
MCEHGYKCESEIAHYLDELAGISGYDEETGESDGMGWYAIFRGPCDVLTDGAVDTEVIASLDEEDIAILTTMAGAILEQHSSGAVYVTTYSSEESAMMEQDWSKLVDDTTQNECDECGAQAEYVGADQDVTHKPDCSERPHIQFMGQMMPMSELMYNDSLMTTVYGGYPLAYITKNGETICAACANTNDHDFPHDPIEGAQVEHDGGSTYDVTCDNCYAVIARGGEDVSED